MHTNCLICIAFFYSDCCLGCINENCDIQKFQRSISTFLYICLSTYKNCDMCSGLLFNYSEIYVPFNVHINENESMNAQWVLSPLSLSFSLAFSSPLSTAIVVLTLLQIPPLQPFSLTHSIMGSLYIYIFSYFFLVPYYVCLPDSFSIRPSYF